ncbi:MAG: hypothetical protein QM784_21295 [Polyangiaceae bacterium]
MARNYLCLLVLVITGACNRGPAEVIREVPTDNGGMAGSAGDSSDGDSGATTRGGASNETSSSQGTAIILDESHPGYRQPACLNCHGSVAPLPHKNETYRPPDCANCHGGNGAPTRDHAVIENSGCANCHSSVAHVPTFTAPADCVVCHASK